MNEDAHLEAAYEELYEDAAYEEAVEELEEECCECGGSHDCEDCPVFVDLDEFEMSQGLAYEE